MASARIEGRNGLGPWKGRVFLAVGRALYLGPAGDTSPHSHHAIQVSVSLQAPLRLRHGGGSWQEYEGVVVSPDVTHQLDGGWGDLALFYVEPQSPDARSLLANPRDPIQTLPSSTLSDVRKVARRIARHPPSQSELGAVVADLMQSIGFAPEAAEPVDRRVEDFIRRLRTQLGKKISMPELAHAVGLSPSRFRHVFRREVGMSAQSYVVWLRINEACAALARGTSLSDAAYQAGFSDAAHFTRTFRRTFGLAPSQLADGLTLHTGLETGRRFPGTVAS